VSIWDALDEEGNLSDKYESEGKKGDDVILDFVLKIKEVNEEIHGDYNNPHLAKTTWHGKALTMFKTWIGMFVDSRFGTKRKSYVLGYEKEGFYSNVFKQLKDVNFKFWELHKKFKNGELTELDIVSIRRLTAEIGMSVSLMLIVAALKNLACDEDDCSEAHWTANLAINILNRTGQDMSSTLSPSGVYGLIKNPMAASRLLEDMSRGFELANTLLTGEEDEIIYKSGYYKDRNKLGVFLQKQIPLYTQVERTIRQASELIEY